MVKQVNEVKVEMNRGSREKFCEDSAAHFNEPQKDWNLMIDKRLDIYVAWFNYLWEHHDTGKNK
jgi:hypothetical protein